MNKNINPMVVLVGQPFWMRIILLIVLGYEAAGCLAGGILLVAAPDGRYMELPVDLMHGTFMDFFIPGILLSGLGILNAFAFVSVLRKNKSDWFMSGLALGGMFIWFVVEILIIGELHWLHIMWGVPVLLGWIAAIPLIAFRNNTPAMRKALLNCGILSSLWYMAVNIIVAATDKSYSSVTLTVSELSAIGAPTRILWELLVTGYPLLFAAFGWGILTSFHENSKLRIAGIFIVAYCFINAFWPPMHLREVIASGGGSITDTLHISWAMVTLLLMMVIMGFGAAALGRRFRFFTVVIWAVFIIFGVLSGLESPGIETNQPTPMIGVWERINIGAFMLWVIVFAGNLLQKVQSTAVVEYNRDNNKSIIME